MDRVKGLVGATTGLRFTNIMLGFGPNEVDRSVILSDCDNCIFSAATRNDSFNSLQTESSKICHISIVNTPKNREQMQGNKGLKFQSWYIYIKYYNSFQTDDKQNIQYWMVYATCHLHD